MSETPIRRSEPVMGTVVSFDIRPGPVPVAEVYLALAESRRILHQVDAVFSTWKPNSPLSRRRRGDLDPADWPPEMAEVETLCRHAKEASGGWFDPWAMPGGYDPTGLVKGWAAGRALHVLSDAGVDAAMVSAGGDIGVHGKPDRDGGPWRIGVQDPWDRAGIIGTVAVTGAIATSGLYERGPHVLDPQTGQPADGAVSATVTGPDLALADALATGLLAGGDQAIDAIRRLPGYSALLVRADRSAVVTDRFPLLPITTS